MGLTQLRRACFPQTPQACFAASGIEGAVCMSESATKIQSLPLVEGQVVTGTLFSEPMRVETIRESGPGTWVVGFCGLNTERFRKVTLTSADLQQLPVQKPHFTYDGDGQVLRIGIQAYSLGI